jgi:hypothetical protein
MSGLVGSTGNPAKQLRAGWGRDRGTVRVSGPLSAVRPTVEPRRSWIEQRATGTAFCHARRERVHTARSIPGLQPGRGLGFLLPTVRHPSRPIGRFIDFLHRRFCHQDHQIRNRQRALHPPASSPRSRPVLDDWTARCRSVRISRDCDGRDRAGTRTSRTDR